MAWPPRPGHDLLWRGLVPFLEWPRRQDRPGAPREFGACTSFSSIAAYRSDAHRLLANVMARPITGGRSGARSGNDRATKGWLVCLNTAGSWGEALRTCIMATAYCSVPGPANVECTDVRWRPLTSVHSSPWLHYLTTHTQIPVDYISSPSALPANRRRRSSDLQGSAWSAADSTRAGATGGTWGQCFSEDGLPRQLSSNVQYVI